MTNEMERAWKEVAMLNLRYYPKICVEGQRKTILVYKKKSSVSIDGLWAEI
jgi:hypothetical protein